MEKQHILLLIIIAIMLVIVVYKYIDYEVRSRLSKSFKRFAKELERRLDIELGKFEVEVEVEEKAFSVRRIGRDDGFKRGSMNDGPYDMSHAEQLKKVRKHMGLSLTEAKEVIYAYSGYYKGLSEATLSRIERGERSLDEATYNKIMMAYRNHMTGINF